MLSREQRLLAIRTGCVLRRRAVRPARGRGRFLLGPSAAALLLAFGSFQPARAQGAPQASQRVGTSGTIVDESGDTLVGTDPDAGRYGAAAIEGDLVQILHATDEAIYPPDVHGQPDPRNVVLATTRIGLGGSPHLANSGRFSALVTPRPGGNTRIFVRVFSSASLEDAAFYGDSQLFTVSGTADTPFLAAIAAADQPLDPDDPDGDGLNNSWERVLGSDPHTEDTDGDGLSDAQERTAGTDPLDTDSFPHFTAVRSGPLGLYVLWPAADGRTYDIYHGDSAHGDISLQDPVASVTATGALTGVWLTGGTTNTTGSFRFGVRP